MLYDVHMPTRYNSEELVRAMNRSRNEPFSIQLQGVGRVPAVFVRELVVGDVLVYNYGSTAEIIAIDPVSEKFVKVTTKVHNRRMNTTSEYSQRMKLDSMRAIVERGSDYSRIIRFHKINRGNA